MPAYYLHWQQNKTSRSSTFFFQWGFLVVIPTSWPWATSATLLTNHLEHKLLDQKNKEFREKEAVFGWVGLAFFASLVVKWAICTISLALILAAHTTKLQAQLIAHPLSIDFEGHGKILTHCETSRLKVPAVVAAADLGRTRGGSSSQACPQSHPPCQTSSSCQHHFLVKLPTVYPLACPWKIRNTQSGIN